MKSQEMVHTIPESVTERLGLRKLPPPREGATFWGKGHPRNLAVGCQKLYGSNKKWKQKYGYHKRSLSEAAMYRVKQLLGASLTL